MLAEYAGNKNKLRGAAKLLSIDELRELKAKLEEIIKKRESEFDAAKAAEIEKLRKQMQKLGITAKELSSGVSTKIKTRKTRKKSGPVAPKYRITVAGQTHQWTGRGRTPKVFAEYFAAGNSRSSCEI